MHANHSTTRLALSYLFVWLSFIVLTVLEVQYTHRNKLRTPTPRLPHNKPVTHLSDANMVLCATSTAHKRQKPARSPHCGLHQTQLVSHALSLPEYAQAQLQQQQHPSATLTTATPTTLPQSSTLECGLPGHWRASSLPWPQRCSPSRAPSSTASSCSPSSPTVGSMSSPLRPPMRAPRLLPSGQHVAVVAKRLRLHSGAQHCRHQAPQTTTLATIAAAVVALMPHRLLLHRRIPPQHTQKQSCCRSCDPLRHAMVCEL